MSHYEFCPRCGHETWDTPIYCQVCGLDLDQLSRGPPKTQEEIEEMP